MISCFCKWTDASVEKSDAEFMAGDWRGVLYFRRERWLERKGNHRSRARNRERQAVGSVCPLYVIARGTAERRGHSFIARMTNTDVDVDRSSMIAEIRRRFPQDRDRQKRSKERLTSSLVSEDDHATSDPPTGIGSVFGRFLRRRQKKRTSLTTAWSDHRHR